MDLKIDLGLFLIKLGLKVRKGIEIAKSKCSRLNLKERLLLRSDICSRRGIMKNSV